MNTDTGPAPGSRPDDYPQPVARIARLLDVHRRTLQRALTTDPTAPGPADHDHNQHPLYLAGDVTNWWPTRRRRGRPRHPTPQTAPQDPDSRVPGEAGDGNCAGA